jgi:hypothetical protein
VLPTSANPFDNRQVHLLIAKNRKAPAVIIQKTWAVIFLYKFLYTAPSIIDPAIFLLIIVTDGNRSCIIITCGKIKPTYPLASIRPHCRVDLCLDPAK